MKLSNTQVVILFVVLSLAGLVMAAIVAPTAEGYQQILLMMTGIALFTSALTTCLIRFTGT
jgi:4-hydroxybenzoate polyprenyltransferase